MGAVASVVEDVGSFVTDQIIEPVVETVQNVVENPQALAVIALSVAAPGVGTAIGSALGASGVAATALGNAVIGGTLSSASGGNFGEGALAGGVGSLVGSYATPAISEALGGGTAGNIGASAITGGTMAELQGGDFTQGALQSGLTSGINQAKYEAIGDYLSDIQAPAYDAATAPTEADVYASMNGESIGNVINAIAPTTDLSTTLYDVGKAVVPIAVGSLLANQVMQPTSEPQSGFGVVSAPGDWRSPEYNMAFTPSAPIDFGNIEMLRGTQFERPSSITDVINAINQPTTNFGGYAPQIQGSTFGVNDIVGNLNSQPVSINDIIANIQSQYGQTT